MPILNTKLKQKANTTSKHSRGFTIVELLISIVVIAIVSYNGTQERATEASLKSDLSQAFT